MLEKSKEEYCSGMFFFDLPVPLVQKLFQQQVTPCATRIWNLQYRMEQIIPTAGNFLSPEFGTLQLIAYK